MKKMLFAAMAAMLLLVGCKKQPSVVNTCLVEDYAYVQQQYEGQDVLFYEAEITLNESPAKAGKKAQPLLVREVFQVGHTVVFIDRDYTTGNFTLSEKDGYWLEDVEFDPNGLADFNDALKALLKSEYKAPDAVFVTLRNPLGPIPYLYPFYIFGSNHTSFIAVNAKTLVVERF